MILQAKDEATMRKSLAEILSGPAAFPASKLDSFFRTTVSVTSEKQKITRQGARVIELVSCLGLAGGVLKWSIYELVGNSGFI